MKDTKICCTCKQLLPIAGFNWKNKARGKLQPQCRICQRITQNKFYHKTPQYQESVKKAAKIRTIDIKIKYLTYLKQCHCIVCGETDPVVLTFDHRDPTQKIECVSIMVQRSCGWSTIKKEIDKCDVVCFNCHARRTAKTQKWYANWKHKDVVAGAGHDPASPSYEDGKVPTPLPRVT